MVVIHCSSLQRYQCRREEIEEVHTELIRNDKIEDTTMSTLKLKVDQISSKSMCTRQDHGTHSAEPFPNPPPKSSNPPPSNPTRRPPIPPANPTRSHPTPHPTPTSHPSAAPSPAYPSFPRSTHNKAEPAHPLTASQALEHEAVIGRGLGVRRRLFDFRACQRHIVARTGRR